jgi:hypothetical protein
MPSSGARDPNTPGSVEPFDTDRVSVHIMVQRTKRFVQMHSSRNTQSTQQVSAILLQQH